MKEQLALTQAQIAAERLKKLTMQNNIGAYTTPGKVGVGAGGVLGVMGQGIGLEASETAALARGSSSIMSSMLGGGMLGTIATGALTGTLVIAAIDAISHAVTGLIDKIKELSIESGKLSHLEDTFQTLAKSRGITDSGALLDGLRKKTHNLVDDTQLLGVANSFLQSHLKLTQTDLLKLTEAVTGLGIAHGKTAQQAMQAEQQFLLTGRAQALARITGIQRQELQSHNVGAAVSPEGRLQAQFNQSSQVIEKEYAREGAPNLTFEDKIAQLHTVEARVKEAFGQGLTKSAGFASIMSDIDSLVDKFGGLEGAAKHFGDSVGNTLNTVVEAFITLGKAVESVKGPIVFLLQLGVAAVAAKMAVSIVTLIGKVDVLIASLEALTISEQSVLTGGLALVGLGLYKVFDHWKDSIAAACGATVTWGDLLGGIIQKLDHLGELDNKTLTQIVADNAKGRQLDENPYQFSDTYGDIKKQQATNDSLYRDKVRPQQEYIATKKQLDAQLKNLSDEMVAHEKYNADKSFKIKVDKLAQEATAEDKAHGTYSPEEEQQRQKKVTQEYSSLEKERDERKNAAAKEVARQLATGNIPKMADVNTSYTAPAPPPSEMGDPKAARRQAQEEAVDARKLLAEEIEDKKDKLADDRAAEDENYHAGVDSLQKYYTTKRALDDRALSEAKVNAQKQFDLTVKEAERKKASGDKDAEDVNLVRIGAQHDLDRANAKAEEEHRKALTGETKGENKDVTTLEVDKLTQEYKTKKALLDQDTSATEHNFKENILSGSDYLEARRKQIEQEVQLVVDERSQIESVKLKNKTWSIEDEKATNDAILAARIQANKSLQQLDQNAPETMFQSSQQRLESINNALKAQQTLAQQSPNNISGADNIEISKQLLENNKAAIASMEQQLESMNGTADEYGTTWFNIYNTILKTVAAQEQLNEQLANTMSALTPIGQAFEAISSEMSGIFSSRFAKGLSEAVGSVGKQFENVNKYADMMSGGRLNAAKKDPQLEALTKSTNAVTDGLVASATRGANALDIFTAAVQRATPAAAGGVARAVSSGTEASGSVLVNTPALNSVRTPGLMAGGNGNYTTAAGNAIEDVSSLPNGSGSSSSLTGTTAPSAMSKFSNELPVLSKQLVGFVSSFGAAVQGILGAQSASAGALAGAGGGAAFGKAGGDALKSITKSDSSAIPVIGEAVGAVVGTIIGMISGNKQEKMQDMINQMNEDFKNMMNAYSTNNANLTTTIQSLQDLITEAQTAEAGSKGKKGGSEFKSLIIQYNEQIQQLEDQAAATMTSLSEQMTSLASPEAYQSILSQVSSIVKQYEQFASAAQSATQVAQANQFLADSLEQLSTQYTTTLNQDEQSAINDALQLNQLLNQRNALNYQYLQQMESIQGQGTLTRSQTSAQSKYSQMYQAQAQYALQLDQINQQIDLAQYQVQAAQTVFNLATTKAGLEAQVLQLQEVGINQDMGRIAAMQQMLATLQSSGYNLVGSTTNANPNAQETAILLNLLTSLGLGSVATGVSTGTDAGTAAALASLYAELTSLGGSGTTSTGQGLGI